MNRLTKKYLHIYVENTEIEQDRYSVNCRCLNKLGKLEDIEEELELPLDVYFKLQKAEFVCVKYGNDVYELPIEEVLNDKHIVVVIQDETTSDELDFCDHGKYWWLKEE